MIGLLPDSDEQMAVSDDLKIKVKGFKEYCKVGKIKGKKCESGATCSGSS